MWGAGAALLVICLLLHGAQGQEPPSHRIPRCFGVKGAWCRAWHTQVALPLVPPPLPASRCAGDCSSIGVCAADTGRCDCPAGEGTRVWSTAAGGVRRSGNRGGSGGSGGAALGPGAASGSPGQLCCSAVLVAS